MANSSEWLLSLCSYLLGYCWLSVHVLLPAWFGWLNTPGTLPGALGKRWRRNGEVYQEWPVGPQGDPAQALGQGAIIHKHKLLGSEKGLIATSPSSVGLDWPVHLIDQQLALWVTHFSSFNYKCIPWKCVIWVISMILIQFIWMQFLSCCKIVTPVVSKWCRERAPECGLSSVIFSEGIKTRAWQALSGRVSINLSLLTRPHCVTQSCALLHAHCASPRLLSWSCSLDQERFLTALTQPWKT